MNQEKTNEELQIEIDQLKTKISKLEKSKVQGKICSDNSPIIDDNNHYDSTITGDINNTEQRQAEEKEITHNSYIDFLSKTAMQFVEFSNDINLYDFVGEQVKRITGKNSYVVVNSVDPKTHFSTVHSILGAGKLINIISKKVGVNPIGMKIEAEDPNIHCKDGKLHIYKEGLYGLLVKTVPKNICKSIEILAGVKGICVIDLANQEQFFGNVVIFLKEKTKELKNKRLIETFIKQASIAILKRQSEEALKINEGKLNLIVNSSPIGICTVDSLGNYITTNPSYERMVGYTKEELAGLSFFDLTHPDDSPKNKKLLQDMFSMKTTNFFIEKKYILKDGKEIHVSVNAIIVKDDEGNVKYGIGFIEDITERIESENTLRNTNARHSAMIKNLGDVISIVDSDGITKYQSSNIEKWFGWKTEDIIGRNNFDYIHPDDLERIQLGFSKILKKETASIENFRFKCKDGKYKWIELTAVNRINDPAINGILTNYHDITKRKQSEQEIFLSNIKYQSLFNNSPIPLWEEDMTELSSYLVELKNKGHKDLSNYFENNPDELIKCAGMVKIIDVNQAALDLHMAKSKNQLIGNIDKIFTENSFSVFKKEINSIVEGNNLFKGEGVVKTLSGDLKNIYITLKIDYSQPDKVKALLATTDITERKQAEEALRKSEKNLQNTFNISPNIISKVNLNTGYFIEVSQAVTRILGYSIEEFISKPYMEFIHPDDRKRTSDKISKNIEDKEINLLENRYLCKDGSYKWLAWHSTKADENGIVTAVASNISERKIAEIEIKKLFTAVQQSPAMLVITDTEGKIEYVNPKFSKVTGYNSAEAIGQKSNILKSGEQKDSFYKDLWETIVSGKIWKGQFHNKKKNGETFWESASISAILNEKNEIINFIKIGEDITRQKNNETELKAALEKALESDRMKSAFIANMSHEIRTPMNGILGFTELLQYDDLSVENQKEFIDMIKESSKRLLNTINDLIEISEIESGEVKNTVNEVAFLNHLKTLVTFYTPEIKNKGLEIFIENEISGSDNVILTDENKLKSILSNLIKNSIKYTIEGFIKVGFKINKGQLIFYCKDSGIGIPKIRQKAIFNRFEQADIEDKQAFQGSGLGLAIVKSYVEMLNGKIWVESEEGKGSIFYVALPYNSV